MRAFLLFLVIGVLLIISCSSENSSELRKIESKCFKFDPESYNTVIDYYDYEDNDEHNESCPRDVVVPEGVRRIDSGALRGDGIRGTDDDIISVTIPKGVVFIRAYAFANNSLTSLVLPEGLVSIETHAFEDNLLESVTFPESLTWIGAFAFSDNSLTSVTLGNRVTTVEAFAFSNNQIESLSIGRGLTNLGGGAFKNNDPLKSGSICIAAEESNVALKSSSFPSTSTPNYECEIN